MRSLAVMQFSIIVARRLALAAVVGLMVATGGRAPSAVAQAFQSAAPQAVVYDVDSASYLFARGADQAIAPASLVKLMTAALVFEEIRQGRLKLDQDMLVSENAWRRGGAVSGGSTMFALPNSRIKVSDLLQGLLVVSGNDAAIALAEGVAGSEPAFVEMMNARARALGLNRLQFRNATGFGHPEQRATLRELVMLARHVIDTYPDLYPLFGQREFTWNRVRQQNRNPLLTMDVGADGMKTGNIEESGFSLIGSAVQNGQRLIVAVSGLKTARDRGIEARKLLDWAFRSFEAREVFAAGEVIGDVAVFGGASGSVSVAATKPVKMLTPRGQSDQLRGRIVYRGPVRAPVAKGSEVARLVVERGDLRALDIPLVATEDVPVGTLMNRAGDAAVELSTGWIKRLIKPDAAASGVKP
jgi:D-alanyl-D-alanine carboxypeptidase (penicillin-binding protein 5/6)